MHLKGMGRIRWDKDVAYIEAVNQRSPRQGATSPRKGSISPPRDGASPRKDKPAGPPPSRPFPDPPGSDGRRSPRETSYRMRQATRETTKIQEAKAEDEKKKAIVEEKRRAEEAKAKAEAEKEAKARWVGGGRGGGRGAASESGLSCFRGHVGGCRVWAPQNIKQSRGSALRSFLNHGSHQVGSLVWRR